MEGHRRSHRVAFPHHRVTARRPKRCLVTSVGSEGCDLCPRKSPILLIVPMASGAHIQGSYFKTATNYDSHVIRSGNATLWLHRQPILPPSVDGLV